LFGGPVETDRHSKLHRLRRQLDDIMSEIQSLKAEHQEAVLLEIENFASIIEDAIRQIDHPAFRRNSGPGADMSTMPFKDWFNEEIRRGMDYGSPADAAAGYEAAGYKWKR
jgi:hypothetical protein